VKKAKCVTIDASLLADAEEAAARLGIPFSALVEEALRMPPQTGRGVERRRGEAGQHRDAPQAVSPEEPGGAAGGAGRGRSRPPQLSDNLWVRY
jgi:hypothetical protein